MGERDDAKGSIEESRDRMNAIVEELMRRATPGYLGDRLKEATVKKTMEIKEKAAASPIAMAILGGSIGAAAGVLFASRSGDREVEIDVDVDVDEIEAYGDRRMSLDDGSGGGLKEKIADVKEAAVEKAAHMKDRAVDTAHDVKEKVADAGYRAKNVVVRAWDEQPLLFAAGFAVAGALASLLMPVTEKERRMMEPARRKATEKIQEIGETLEEKLGVSEDVPPRDGGATGLEEERPDMLH